MSLNALQYHLFHYHLYHLYLMLVILKNTIQWFIRKKNAKSVKQSEIITYQSKTFENPNIVGIKSVIIEHSKTSHKLSKTIRQKAEKEGSNSSSYSNIKKVKIS